MFLKARKKCGFEEVALVDFQATKRQLPSYLVSHVTVQNCGTPRLG